MNATKTIPIVMAGRGFDPIGAGLVESLARPGGNVTGVTLLSTELGGKRLELLKEVVPKVAHVAVLYDPAILSSVNEVKEDLPVASRALKLTIQPWEIRAADDFEQVFAALSKQRPDVLYVHGGGLLCYGGRGGNLPARRILRGQNPQGSQACRSACGTADQVRAGG